MKFTPGPWEVGNRDKRNVHIHYAWRDVATCPVSHEDTNANARLIAAAPEMYGLLKALATIGFTAAIARDTEKLLKRIEE